MGELLREGIIGYTQWNFHRPQESLNTAFGPELAAKVPDIKDPRIQVWIAAEIGSKLDAVLTDFVDKYDINSCVMIGGVAYSFTGNNLQELSADEFQALENFHNREKVAQVWIFMPLVNGDFQSSDLLKRFEKEGRILYLDPYLPKEPDEFDAS